MNLIDFLIFLAFYIQMKRKKHQIKSNNYTHFEWKESQKARKSQEASKALKVYIIHLHNTLYTYINKEQHIIK